MDDGILRNLESALQCNGQQGFRGSDIVQRTNDDMALSRSLQSWFPHNTTHPHFQFEKRSFSIIF